MKVEFIYFNKFRIITCKITSMIQGILSSHYLHNVNLSNYGLSHVPKSVHLNVLSPYFMLFGCPCLKDAKVSHD